MAKSKDPYQMAQFKFGLIAPLVQKTYPDASAAAYCRRVAELPLTLPDGTERRYEPATIARWADYYMEYQMAQFKFGLIAPLVQKTYPDASAAAYCRRVAELPLTLPDGTERRYEPATIARWADYYMEGGLDALIKQPRKDKGETRVLPSEAAARIYAIKEQFPKLPATQVRLRLLEEGLIPINLSVRCIQRFVKDWDFKHGRPLGGKDRKAFETEYFGALWQADTCYFPYIPDGSGKKRRTYLVLILDDYSRMIVGARIYFSDSAENFQATLKTAVSVHGIVQKLYCDHGSPYINKQLEFICADIGTILRHPPVRDSSAKGKCERVFRSIKERWLYGIDTSKIKSLEEFNTLLTAHIREYNMMKHSSTGEAPMDRFLRTRGIISAPQSREWLDDKFMNRVTRKVNGDSTVKLEGVLWDAPMQFIGYTVEVRFAPGGDGAYISADGTRYPLSKTDKAANARTRRSNSPAIDYSQIGDGCNV